jgi:hypothetical protein
MAFESQMKKASPPEDNNIKIVGSNLPVPIKRKPRGPKESELEKARNNFELNKISHHE